MSVRMAPYNMQLDADDNVANNSNDNNNCCNNN